MGIVDMAQHVQETVAQEREEVKARLEGLRAQAERLHGLVDRLDREVDSDTRLLRQMDEMLGIAPQLALDLHGELRGRRLQEVAIQLLRDCQRETPGATVHYRDWYDLLVEAGLQIAGQDPVATFLTSVSRAPAVESVRPRSGLYRLRTA
jgi:predicted metal-dependent hydrolase